MNVIPTKTYGNTPLHASYHSHMSRILNIIAGNRMLSIRNIAKMVADVCTKASSELLLFSSLDRTTAADNASQHANEIVAFAQRHSFIAS